MRYAEGYIGAIDRAASELRGSGLAGSSVLVTGASGLIGSALADVLMQANREHGLDVALHLAGRSPKKLADRFAYWGDGGWDAVEYDALEPVNFGFRSDFIVHCASNAHPRAYTEQPVETMLANVNGTAGILSYARDTAATRVLYVSSSEVYGTRAGREPYREEDCFPMELLNPRSCYPSSKRACETLCASYAREYGVESVIARPGHVYGPTATGSDSRAHAQFARMAAYGEDIVMKSSGEQLRSYVFCTDSASALLTVLLRGEAGTAYNVGDPGFTCTIRELASAFAVAGGVGISFDMPTEIERAGYNPMACSALDCSRLAGLGFSAKLSLEEAAAITIGCLR